MYGEWYKSGWWRDQIPQSPNVFIEDLIMWQHDWYLHTDSKNGILHVFGIFPFETNLNFWRRQIRFPYSAVLASLSKWRYKKKLTWFLIMSHILFVKHRNCVWKFKSIDIWYYLSEKKFQFKLCVLFKKWWRCKPKN